MTEDQVKDSLVAFENHQGIELRGTLVRLGRLSLVFEVYNAGGVLRLSEVLNHFRIIFQERGIYSGRAVVASLLNTGLSLVCEVNLEESSWLDVHTEPFGRKNGQFRDSFSAFIQEWQKLYRVADDYKVIVADMQTFFADLRLWLDQVELGVRAAPTGDRVRLEQSMAEDLTGPIVSSMDALFEKFEAITGKLDAQAMPVHGSYMRRHLHPWVMCAPFAYRTFHKPLGYAGDYEMVNMIVRAAQEGGSLYAKVINTWFLQQPPAQAHRNRIQYLVKALLLESIRVSTHGRPLRVLNVACGPGQEVQRFLSEQAISSRLNITMLDFNDETLQYAREALTAAALRHGRQPQLQFVKRSVHQILKEGGRSIQRSADTQYDFVYCAGLFDYLTDPICHRLMNIMYEWLAPGGLLLTTNVHPCNPLRHGMGHLLDWHLVYRSAQQMQALKPLFAADEDTSVSGDDTGVNLFLEVRKQSNA